MRRRTAVYCFVAGLLGMMSSSGMADAKKVTVEQNRATRQVTVKIGDEIFTVFNLDSKWPKPFAAPVNGPGGIVMTREIAKPGVKVDHPHHKGIWVAVDEVNYIKYWAEQAKIINFAAGAAEGNPATLTLRNHWMGKEDPDEAVMEETTKISIFPNRMMVYDITFKALEKPVTFRDTKEGLFGFRMVDSLRETETGKVINSDGLKGTKEAWGKPADWVDYYGQIQGKTLGVALFDHPDNFRRSRYHVRNYGLFSVSPFGDKAYAKQETKPYTIEPGKTLRLRYGIYIHAGDTTQAKVADVFQDFVKYAKNER